jgi:hypothetical protein
MKTAKRSLTDAHHHLADLLDLVRGGVVVELVNGKRGITEAYLVPPKVAEALLRPEGEEAEA